MILPRPTTGRPKSGDKREGRNKKLCIRISEIDLKRLAKLSKFYGLTKTDCIIMLINDGIYEMSKLTNLSKNLSK